MLSKEERETNINIAGNVVNLQTTDPTILRRLGRLPWLNLPNEGVKICAMDKVLVEFELPAKFFRITKRGIIIAPPPERTIGQKNSSREAIKKARLCRKSLSVSQETKTPEPVQRDNPRQEGNYARI